MAANAGQGKGHSTAPLGRFVGAQNEFASARMTDFREPSDGVGGSVTGPREADPATGRPTGRPTGPATVVPTVPPPPTVRTATVPPPPVASTTADASGAAPVPPAPGFLARSWWFVRTAIRYAMMIAIGYAALVAVLIVAYRWINPPATTLILAQRAGGTAIRQAWMPLDRISPNLVRAVIMSEDARFCSHGGVDWKEIEQAFEQAQDGIARGGSTISMQVAKNLFLWPSKSYIRKALEIPETLAMEALWDKRRMLEIYLNIAEWGPGIFGAEAAAQYHFRKPAIRLTEAEAALLAVALPNPIQREAGRPTTQMQRMAQVIQGRMRGSAPYVKCILG